MFFCSFIVEFFRETTAYSPPPSAKGGGTYREDILQASDLGESSLRAPALPDRNARDPSDTGVEDIDAASRAMPRLIIVPRIERSLETGYMAGLQ